MARPCQEAQHRGRPLHVSPEGSYSDDPRQDAVLEKDMIPCGLRLVLDHLGSSESINIALLGHYLRVRTLHEGSDLDLHVDLEYVTQLANARRIRGDDIRRHGKLYQCKLTDCVEVCPVDCFHEGPNILVIDPDECIDCTLCEPECPVEAIFSEDELPEDQEKFLKLNEELSRDWPVITEMKDPPEDADDWREIKDKFQYLER